MPALGLMLVRSAYPTLCHLGEWLAGKGRDTWFWVGDNRCNVQSFECLHHLIKRVNYWDDLGGFQEFIDLIVLDVL